jgi:DNA polymerase I-like protein with 3'-5' exonuclease and polymerase domains
LACDAETTGTSVQHGDRPFIISWATKGGFGKWEAPVNPATRKVTWEKKVLRDVEAMLREHTLVFHNGKFEQKMLMALGINLPEICRENGFHDTLSLSHILRNNELHGLKPLAWKYLGIPETDEHMLHACVIHIHERIRNGKLKLAYRPHPVSRDKECDYWLARYHPSEPHRSACDSYAEKDAIRTLGLLHFFSKVWDKETEEDQRLFQDIYWRELSLSLHLADLERKPINFFPEVAKEYSFSLKKEVARVDGELLRLSTKLGSPIVNPNSDAQVRKLIFTECKLTPIRLTDKAKLPAVGVDDLEDILGQATGELREVIQHLQARSKDATRIGYIQNYFDHLTKAKKICANLKQHGTKFTRFSASEPNLQNVGNPDEEDKKVGGLSLRSLFGPGPGEIWYSLDYSQIEMRLFAVIAKALRLQELFSQGGDVYKAIASIAQEIPIESISKDQRSEAKTIGLGTIYGLGQSSVDARTYLGAYKEYTTKFLPEVGMKLKSSIEEVKRNGCVRTLSGYRLYIDSDRPYSGVNGECQGSAGDIIKLAMVFIGDFLKAIKAYPELRMALQIHDEIILVGTKRKQAYWEEKVLPTVRWLMTKAGEVYGANVPTDCESIFTSWDIPVPNEVTVHNHFPEVTLGLPSLRHYTRWLT